MSTRKNDESAAAFSLGDIYFVLFRQKWKILACALAGVMAAGVLLVLKPAQYQSEAKLLIRYVEETRSQNPNDSDSIQRSTDPSGASILATELDILTSLDLANQVVAAVGAEKLNKPGPNASDTNLAAGMVLKGIIIDPITRGNVIPIAFQHPNREVAQMTLGAIMNAYFKRHAETYKPVGIFSEFQEKTERLRDELEKTERELQQAKRRAGIISLEDSKKAWTEEISRLRQELSEAEAELAEHRATLQDAGAAKPAANETAATNTVTGVPADKMRDYRLTCTRLESERQTEQEYLVKYVPESFFVVQIREKIAEDEKAKGRLEAQYPNLKNLVVPVPRPAGSPATGGVDLAAEAVRVRQLESKTNSLNQQLAKIRNEAAAVEELESSIMDLQRRRDAQEANLKYYVKSLEQNRIDAELSVGKGTKGISVIQSPTPPQKKRPKSLKKLIGMTLAGGLFGGIGLAFAIEMFLDGTVRRPVEIERKVKLPLYITIPDLNRNGHRLARQAAKEPLLLQNGESQAVVVADGVQDASPEAAPWDPGHALHPFYAGLRDRLIVNFEVRNLTHNPKLVAVTSCHKGAGVSTIAAGLAASLSETGMGNVLLVDMNAEQGAAQQFYKGRPGCGLDDALETETMGNALVQGNLYVATEGGRNGNLPRVLPKRFATLMPKLKTSDYDYIIFDMPPVSQTSMTPRLSGYMDMTLLVVESEKTNVDAIKRANSLLQESKSKVSTVLNKTRSYIPPQLHQEALGDS